MTTNAGGGPNTSGITFSRFLIWNSNSLAGCAANDRDWFAEFLRSTGYKALADIHGLAPLSLAGCANALEQVLIRNNLGVLAHGWWPADTADADAASHTLLNESVAVLGLGVRSTNGLIHVGALTIGELIRLSTEDLMAVRNLGRKSVFEIQGKLASLQLSELRAEPASFGQNAFSLAVLMNVGNFRLSKGLARSLERADVSRIYDLVTRSPSALREPARFTPPELTELLIWLARFRLRLNMPHDGWLRAHFDELRGAFREDIARVTAADATEPELAVSGSLAYPTPAPLCLEDELENALSPRLPDKKARIVRRFLGWDGGSAGTLEETGQAFGVTRERIRQVIARSIQKPSGVDLTFLRRAIACIEACIPSVPERAEAALVEAGLVREPFRLESIVATAKAFEVPVPWRLESWAGGRLVVDEQSSTQIRRFHCEARRRVSHYGVTSKSHVLSELSSNMTLEGADVACSVLEELRWLDDAREWFWLSTGRNTVLSRLAKILVVAPKLRTEVAHAGVMRDRRMSDAELPIEVFRNLCITLPWCQVADGYVIAGEGVPNLEELESAEATLIDILRERGPSLRTSDLRRLAMSRGIGDVFFYRLLSDSNLIVQHSSDIYGLIGSDGAVSRPCPLPEPRVQELPELSVSALDESASKHILSGCNADSPTFPMDVLARVVLRSAPFRQRGEMWSIVELHWTDLDQQVLRMWAQNGDVDLRKLCREPVTSGSLRFDGAEAVAVVFLATCCAITRAEGSEGEMWPSIQAAFGHRLRSRLFLGPGVPKAQIREASERICFKLGIRHLFGREGEQSWLRTVFLQFGMTRSGWQRLPWWLSQSSVLPVAIEDLLQSTTLRSQSFGDFWRTLQRYRSGQLLRERAVAALRDNPWVAPGEIEGILAAAIERRDVQRVAGSEDLAVDQLDRLFDLPLLCWIGDSPRFELRLRPHSRWLTEPRYVLVVNNVKHVPVTRQGEEYKIESPNGILSIDLTCAVVSLDLRRKQTTCLPEPLTIRLHPESGDFTFYDLTSGQQLPYGDENLRPNHGYALLSKSALAVNEEALEMRRVFGGDWTIRAYRNGVPKGLEIRRHGEILWNMPEDPSDRGSEKQTPRPRVGCLGGRWGEVAYFTVQVSPELVPTHLLLDGDRTPLERMAGGMYRAAMTLSPNVDYERGRTRIECLWRGRLRWLNADLVMGSLQGIAIETEAGWKVLRENKDMDAEYLQTRRIWARLPTRYEGDDVLAADWAWMEGPHFCGRPRTAATAIGSTVHAIGEPLRLSLGPYNCSARGFTIARSVIHSGVIARSEKSEDGWHLQLRQTFELGPDHAIWIWRSGATHPELLDRTKWCQGENICYLTTDSEAAPVAMAIAFQGAWLGARTCDMGWMGFAEVIRSSGDWSSTASWLRWWRVPLLHEAIKSAAEAAVRADPVRTIRAWASRTAPSAELEHSEEFDDAWRSLIRAFLWDWQPDDRESGAILTELDLLSGDIEQDVEHAWEGCEDIVSIHPLLLVQAAARGLRAIYPTSDPDDRRFFLKKLRNRLLDIEQYASRSELTQALRESQQRAAEAMAVDELFVSKSLLPDGVALIKGNLDKHHNLRVAIANSQTVPKYLAAAILEKMISGEIQ